MSPVAISGVDKQGVDINGVQVKQSLIDTSETVNKGVYAATTLSTVDGDLATGNIKSGVTIFGKLGTHVGTLAEDVEGDAPSTDVTPTAATYAHYTYFLEENPKTLAGKTLNFNATSLAFAVGFASASEGNAADDITLRLYMDGVLLQSSAELPVLPHSLTFVLRDFKALSGNKFCYIAAASAPANGHIYLIGGDATSGVPAAIAVGSVKLV